MTNIHQGASLPKNIFYDVAGLIQFAVNVTEYNVCMCDQCLLQLAQLAFINIIIWFNMQKAFMGFVTM